MNNSPLVSIIMPAYNSAAYIQETLDSVLNQTFSDWELIIINDCSTDHTLQLIQQYQEKDQRIQVETLPKNKGAPAGPRNIGIQKARGQWIAFLDSDDIWHPEKLRVQLSALEQYKAQFCSTKMRNFKTGQKPILSLDNPLKIQTISFFKQLLRNRTPTSSVIAKRELLLKLPFNEDMRYKAREDLDCWLHCHEEAQFSVKIDSPLVGYRVIEGQISGKKWLMMKRHFYVMRNYQLRSGRTLTSVEALFFTTTHFVSAFYQRYFNHGF